MFTIIVICHDFRYKAITLCYIRVTIINGMCYIMLHYVTLCYVVLHHVALCYVVLHHVALCYVVLHHFMYLHTVSCIYPREWREEHPNGSGSYLTDRHSCRTDSLW